MSPPTEEVLSLDLPCDFGAPGLVRAALEELDWLGWVLGDVLLISTELINCAVLKCGASSEQSLRVAGWLTEGSMHLEVTTPSKPRHIAPAAEDAASDEGWARMIIEQLAARWGEEEGPSYGIWAEIELPEPSARRLPDH